MVLRQDLLPLPGGAITFAGCTASAKRTLLDQRLIRADWIGHILPALVSAELARRDISSGRRILHYIGLTASLAMALMPMFRSWPSL